MGECSGGHEDHDNNDDVHWLLLLLFELQARRIGADCQVRDSVGHCVQTGADIMAGIRGESVLFNFAIIPRRSGRTMHLRMEEGSAF